MVTPWLYWWPTLWCYVRWRGLEEKRGKNGVSIVFGENHKGDGLIDIESRILDRIGYPCYYIFTMQVNRNGVGSVEKDTQGFIENIILWYGQNMNGKCWGSSCTSVLLLRGQRLPDLAEDILIWDNWLYRKYNTSSLLSLWIGARWPALDCNLTWFTALNFHM